MLFDSMREKQRWIAFAIALFLVFDFSVLGLNYWLSYKIEKEALAINLAGRQRMLSQRVVNSLLNIQLANQRGANVAPFLDELKKSSALFDNTHKAFKQKHLTYDGGFKPVYLQALQKTAQLKIWNETDLIWQHYNKLVQMLLANPPNRKSEKLNYVVDFASAHSPHLLNLMNNLTLNLQHSAQRQTEQIRAYQGIAFLLSLLNFFGIYYLFNQRINKTSQNNLMLSGIINKVSVSVLIIDSKKFIIDSNLTAQTQFQYQKSEMIDQHISRFIDIDTSIDKLDTKAKCKDGSQFMAQVEQNAIQFGTIDATILTIKDVTKQQEKEKQLSQMAHHDNLTGLPNRILFNDRLSLEINHMRRDNSLLAVMFIDLDRFKPINDNYGHSAGDAVLIQIAQRISICLRDIDTVSRRGGDEFTVILSGITDIADSEKVANAILVELAKPFIYNDKQIYASASIGISLYPLHGETTEQLLAQADKAMYQAKAKGGNQIYLLSESMG